MAPSEFDLRAALRDGEGEGINPDNVIFAVERHRARRRAALLTAATVVALVGGGAAGISQLSGGSEAGGSNAGDAMSALRAGAGAISGRGPQHGTERSAAGLPVPRASLPLDQKLTSIACPTGAPTYSVPQAPQRRDAATPLFTNAVAAVVVCSYGTTFGPTSGSTTRQPGRLTLAGGKAAALARSMEKASRDPKLSCAAHAPARAQYAIIAVSPSGDPAGPTVSAQTGCNGVVTNGTALRFNWSPPPDIAARLEALNARAGPSASPTG
jgi:hypothetical protein